MRTRIRSATLTGFPQVARALALDPKRLLARVGLDITDLVLPEKWIPAAPAAWLLEASAQLSGCADFALRMAGLRQLGTLGPLAVVLRDEPDLRSALGLLIRYERAYNEALHLRLRESDGNARVETWLEFGEPAPTAQASDLVMGALVGIVRALLRPDWEPLAALFAHAAPADVGPYRRMFGAGVRFDQDVTALVFAGRDLAAPLATSDPSLRPFTRRFLHTVMTPGTATASGQVGEVVEFLLPLGRSSLEEVGRHLGIGARLLQRSLAAEGTSFAEVLHATRARLAERYLTHDRYTLTEVSQLLDFAAPSAFSRWFRQQFGVTPTAWRMGRRLAAEPGAGGPGGPAAPARPAREPRVDGVPAPRAGGSDPRVEDTTRA